MHNKLKEPCPQCPFRKKALPGWLGSAPPEEFTEGVNLEIAMPCHMTVDYRNPNWRDTLHGDKAARCAGASAFAANCAKMPRNSIFREHVEAVGKRDDVFETPQDFIDHHRASRVRSWEF